MSLPSVIVISKPGASLPAELDALSSVANVLVARDAETLRQAREQANVALVWDFQTELLREVGPGGLEWIHANSIGVDAIMTPDVVRSPVVVTNTRGVYERPIAEFVLAALLFFTKELPRTIQDQRARVWGHRPTEPIADRRALVLGPGPVGREITLMLRAVGITVDVVGRRAREDEPELGRVHGQGELDALLGQADDVIVALPLTADTRGIVDADCLARFRTGARIINVGRGPLIDEDALLAALRSGRVGAAALDVFEQEPLPCDHPFWEMDNVLVSPHMSGDAFGWQRTVIDLFLDNMERWRSGRELRNVVDKQGFALGAAV
jgi:phosphoglycerate dehydrogenase-like enzyme